MPFPPSGFGLFDAAAEAEIDIVIAVAYVLHARQSSCVSLINMIPETNTDWLDCFDSFQQSNNPMIHKSKTPALQKSNAPSIH